MKRKANSRLKPPPSPAEESDWSSDNEPCEPKREEEEPFSLYALLQVDRKASKDEIKKQYRKLVLQYHPDKNKEDPNANEKFQKLKQAYDILIDDEKRQQYDETGSVGKQFNQATFQSAYEYYRKMFKPISKEDIEDFEKQYKHGKMEEEDLLQYYETHEGDMKALLQCIPLSASSDVPRFIAFFEEKIANKEIKRYKAFNTTKGKVRQMVNEEKQWEEEQKKKDFNSLVLAIQSKSNQQVNFIESLEKKYGAGKKQKISKKK